MSAKGLTYRYRLPGGQARLKELILHVSDRSAKMPRFGLTKLNKIIWRADFTAYAARRVPITGEAYQRLQNGPAPVEMKPLLGEMKDDGLIEYDYVDFGDGRVEQRVIALTTPNLRMFSGDDLQYVEESIQYYWNKTGRDASEDSHGVAWQTREDGDPMPYELAFLSDKALNPEQLERLGNMARERNWTSD